MSPLPQFCVNWIRTTIQVNTSSFIYFFYTNSFHLNSKLKSNLKHDFFVSFITASHISVKKNLHLKFFFLLSCLKFNKQRIFFFYFFPWSGASSQLELKLSLESKIPLSFVYFIQARVTPTQTKILLSLRSFWLFDQMSSCLKRASSRVLIAGILN